MKKHVLLIYCLVCQVIMAGSQNITASAVNLRTADTLINRLKYNYITRHTNGQISESGNYKRINGELVRHGPWAVYDEQNKLMERGSYIKGKKEGLWYERDEDGFCCWSGEYRNNKKHGRWTDGAHRFRWYKKGKLKKAN